MILTTISMPTYVNCIVNIYWHMNIILIQCKKLVTCDDLKKQKRYLTFSNNPPKMRFFRLNLWNKPGIWHPEQSIQTLLQYNRLEPGLQLLLGEFGMKLKVGRDGSVESKWCLWLKVVFYWYHSEISNVEIFINFKVSIYQTEVLRMNVFIEYHVL